LFEQLKQKYLSSFEDKMKLIENALESSDVQVLSNLIHQIAGSSGSYGLTELSEHCLMIEEKLIADADFTTEIVPSVKTLLVEMKRLSVNSQNT
jgi:HPt (histidine-containing phosphotransfer) domain-containing protein